MTEYSGIWYFCMCVFEDDPDTRLLLYLLFRDEKIFNVWSIFVPDHFTQSSMNLSIFYLAIFQDRRLPISDYSLWKFPIIQHIKWEMVVHYQYQRCWNYEKYFNQNLRSLISWTLSRLQHTNGRLEFYDVRGPISILRCVTNIMILLQRV